MCPSQHDTVQPTPHDRTTAEALPLAAARDTGQKGGREGGRGGRGNSLRYSRQLWSSVSISKYTASHCDGPKRVLKQCMELHPPCMVGGRLFVGT